MKLDTTAYESKMKKTIEVYEDNLASVRVGRANAAVLSRVTVDYYGTPTPISSVANVNVSDARTLTITPWDASLNKPIEKAILASDVGITPSNDGKVIRLMFPQLTEERRKELKKQICTIAAGMMNCEEDAVEFASTCVRRVGTEQSVSLTDIAYKAQVFWLEKPNNPDGSIRTDVKNPDPAKRNTPSDQIVLIESVSYNGEDNVWDDGNIYDPTSGKVYKTVVDFKDNKTLRVRGYLGPFSKSLYWEKLN